MKQAYKVRHIKKSQKGVPGRWNFMLKEWEAQARMEHLDIRKPS